jgi:NAD(P)-dependent dehydrogenase (short-subunit alcohol dehydrogenase family)
LSRQSQAKETVVSKSVALVTGASSGIGKATALRLAALGFTVYAAARRVERMSDLADHGIHVESLDVTDDGSMVTVVDKIVSEHGRIDILVNNAGYGSYGAVEDVPIAEARRQFDVNVRAGQLTLSYRICAPSEAAS